MVFNSRAREEERRQADQVQGPLQPRALHPRPQGQRQGREAQAVPSSQYANTDDLSKMLCDLVSQAARETVADKSPSGLTIVDTPKKNARGKRVAQSS